MPSGIALCMSVADTRDMTATDSPEYLLVLQRWVNGKVRTERLGFATETEAQAAAAERHPHMGDTSVMPTLEQAVIDRTEKRYDYWNGQFISGATNRYAVIFRKKGWDND